MNNYQDILNQVDGSVQFKQKEEPKEQTDVASVILEQNMQLYKLTQQCFNQGNLIMAIVTMIAEKNGVNLDELVNSVKKQMEKKD
jgi:hypothetical protein